MRRCSGISQRVGIAKICAFLLHGPENALSVTTVQVAQRLEDVRRVAPVEQTRTDLQAGMGKVHGLRALGAPSGPLLDEV